MINLGNAVVDGDSLEVETEAEILEVEILEAAILEVEDEDGIAVDRVFIKLWILALMIYFS